MPETESSSKKGADLVSKIESLRKTKGYTQKDLSILIGVTDTTIANWERGRSGLDWFERVDELCTALNCKPGDLYERRSVKGARQMRREPPPEKLYALHKFFLAEVEKNLARGVDLSTEKSLSAVLNLLRRPKKNKGMKDIHTDETELGLYTELGILLEDTEGTQITSNVKELREQVGYTQRILSFKAHIGESTVANWERGRSGLEWFEKVNKLCIALHCKPGDLYERRFSDIGSSSQPTIDDLYEIYIMAQKLQDDSQHSEEPLAHILAKVEQVQAKAVAEGRILLTSPKDSQAQKRSEEGIEQPGKEQEPDEEEIHHNHS